jgi:hypothetical protein
MSDAPAVVVAPPAVAPPAVAPPSLIDPKSMFAKNNEISDKLNDFQTRYTRFIRCQDENTAPFVHPECTSSDSFINVQRSYQSLLTSIEDMQTSVTKTQVLSGTTNEETDRQEEDILATYAKIREQRKQLDMALERMYSENKAGPGSSKDQLQRSMYANTLWVILASCLVWYVVVEMK